MSEIQTTAIPFKEFSPIFFEEESVDLEVLFEENLKNLQENQIVTGIVTGISKDYVTVDINYKSEGCISIHEFWDHEQKCTVAVGDEVEVFLEALEDDQDGVVCLSKVKAEKRRVWERIGQVYEDGGLVEGVILCRIKGGLSVDIGVKAFLPGSQVDLRPVRNLDKLIGERFQFKVLKFNQQRGNIVLSRRAILEVEREERRQETLKVLADGATIKGHVKNITDYGVFIDLGGVDGLLHITDITWGRIVHPSEMFNVGDEVEVIVLKYHENEGKVSLGLKQKTQNPWQAVLEKYPVGTRISGKIVALADYGAFIELEPGVEGLIHVSEMSWTKKVRNPSKLVNIGDTVDSIVKELDVERKRISLSMKEALPNPWQMALEHYPIGCIVKGKVRNVTDFGIFVGIDEGIDGLVHISDLSWSHRQRRPSDFAKKGDDIEVKVLNIDVEKERLSLGIKQLTSDPWQTLDQKFEIGGELEGVIANITDFGIFVEVMDEVEGLVHISEIDPAIPKNKLVDLYPVGTKVRARVIKIDTEERRLGLTILYIEGGLPVLPIEAETLVENESPATEVEEIVEG